MRGLAAAHEVFADVGLSPAVAQLAFDRRRAWIQSGFTLPDPGRSELQAAATFALARRCAIAACTGGADEPAGCQLTVQLAT